MLGEAATLGADGAFDCQRARGLLLLARGDTAAADALLSKAWETLRERDPVNASVRALAEEVEQAHRQAGNLGAAGIDGRAMVE